MMARVAALATAMMFGSGALFPCGGPGNLPIDAPLVDADGLVNQLLELDDYWGPSEPAQAWFAYPLAAAHLDRREAEWLRQAGALASYPDTVRAQDSTIAVSLAPLRTAAAGGDRDAIATAARAIVERVLDLPAPLADRNQPAFRRAVEYLELAPVLAHAPLDLVRAFVAESTSASPRWPAPLQEALRIRSMTRAAIAAFADSSPTSPRAPSLRYVALQERMKREIPNGWGDDIRKLAPVGLWSGLLADHERWLADFPDSPLADLVRLSRLRIHQFAGDRPAARRVLLEFYPTRRPARVLYELRLAKGAFVPDSVADAPLKLALARGARSGWCERWRATEASPSRAWAITQQEQELFALTKGLPTDGLPECFPTEPAKPTDFWAKARLAALLKHGRLGAAKRQLALLGGGPEVAPIAARFALIEGRWVDAILTPGLDSAAVWYLTRVRAPRAALDTLARSGPAWIRHEAALTLAIDRAGQGDWAGGGALLAAARSGRAALWRQADGLSRDTTDTGRLTFARFLVRQEGRLFYSRRRDWYRSVAGRREWLGHRLAGNDGRPKIPADSVPVVEAEREAVRGHLLRSTERYLALAQYRIILDRADRSTPNLGAIVGEADRVYRSLIDWTNHTTQFWQTELADGQEARAIRRAGRLGRARRP